MANSIVRYTGTSPENKSEIMSKVTVTTAGLLSLAEITANDTYTIHFWIKASGSRSAILYLGDNAYTTAVTTAWKEFKYTADANAKTMCEIYLPTGIYYIWHIKLEQSTKVSDYTQAPEDVDQSITTAEDNALNRAKDYVTEVLREYSKTKETWSEIKQTQSEIRLSVNEQITETKTYALGVAGDAEANAKADTTEKLKSYATITAMNAAITTKADSITAEVSRTYATKVYTDNKFGNYSTTAQMNAAITAKADSITSTVNTKFNDYSTTTQMNTAINQKADRITVSVNKTLTDYSTTTQMNAAIKTAADIITSTIDTKFQDYSTTTQMNSAISQSATSIKADVTQTLRSYSTTTQMNSAISQSATSIKADVTQTLKSYSTTTQMNTAINQKADRITVSVNKTLTDYSTTTQMNAAINAKADSITSTVNKTYATQATVNGISARMTSAESSITQNATAISLRVKKADLVSEINQSAGTISMTSNRFTVSSTNFTLTANGTITATNANLTNATITGSFKTLKSDASYLFIHGNIMEFFRSDKRLAYIQPINYVNDDVRYPALGIMASGNYNGLIIGAHYSGGWEGYYHCNIQDMASKLGCRHLFRDNVKFLGQFVSRVNFVDNIGVAWGGNTGLRYCDGDTGSYGSGLYLGITANDCYTYLCARRTCVRGGSLDIADGHGIRCTGDKAFWWNPDNNSLYVGIDGATMRLIGSDVYCNGSPVATTSDARKKKDITPLTAKHLNLIKAIEPVSFSYTSDLANSGRTHTGFIAQQVLSAMENLGIDTQEFAAFIDVNRRGEEYALRYEEFIPLLLMYIKHLDQRLTSIENGGTN